MRFRLLPRCKAKPKKTHGVKNKQIKDEEEIKSDPGETTDYIGPGYTYYSLPLLYAHTYTFTHLCSLLLEPSLLLVLYDSERLFDSTDRPSRRV